MLLAALLAVPFITGFLCLLLNSRLAQGLTLVGILLNAAIILAIGQEIFKGSSDSLWLLQYKLSWIPSWSINFHLGLDSFAFWLLALTQILALCSIYVSSHRRSSYFATLNWAIFGILGLFLSADTFLFFVFWELALLPIYWILIRSEEIKGKDTLLFIVLTQISGLFLLIGVLALAYLHHQHTGIFTFDYEALTRAPVSNAGWLLAIFLVAFLIKLPAVPFHGFMRPLFSQAPAATVFMAILVKTSIFGLVRFSWSIFPTDSSLWAMPVMIIGIITLIYGAMLAFSEQEPMAVIAYATLSHAGLLVMGVFGQQFSGVLILLISSALSTAALLILCERRQLTHISGLWESHPKWSVALLTMLLASMGFPIFGNFVGEWLILWAVFSSNVVLAAIASVGIVLSAAYGLKLFQRLSLGQPAKTATFADLSMSEVSVLGVLTLLVVGLGLAPGLIFEASMSVPINEIGLNNPHEVSP